MKLTEIIEPQAILDQLEATDKEGVIREMVEALMVAGRIPERSAKKVIAALLEREELGSTGIGQGIAVPHTKHETVTELVGAFGRSRKGIDFDALDGEPVYIVFLLLSSKDASGSHLEVLAYISRLLRDEIFCRFLREAKSKKELAELLQEADERLATK